MDTSISISVLSEENAAVNAYGSIVRDQEATDNSTTEEERKRRFASVARPTSSVTTFVLATKEYARTSQMKIKQPNVKSICNPDPLLMAK